MTFYICILIIQFCHSTNVRLYYHFRASLLWMLPSLGCLLHQSSKFYNKGFLFGSFTTLGTFIEIGLVGSLLEEKWLNNCISLSQWPCTESQFGLENQLMMSEIFRQLSNRKQFASRRKRSLEVICLYLHLYYRFVRSLS